VIGLQKVIQIFDYLFGIVEKIDQFFDLKVVGSGGDFVALAIEIGE
jgi:hypothetical protein